VKKAPKENPFQEFVRKYFNDPVAFVREVLGFEPDAWQVEMLEAIAKGERQISVRSGHGVGKSSGASWAMIWFLTTRYPVKVVVTAPTSAQLFDALFAELKTNLRKLPPALQELYNVKQERVELVGDPEGAFISARTARAESPEALQGVHSENVLLVADEASGVPEPVFEAAIGSMSGTHATTLLLGNPTRTSGFFFDSHNKNRGDWHTIHVSCLTSRLVSEAFVQQVARTYGEDSNAYRVRVLGEFPRSDDDTVISLELVEGAMQRDVATTAAQARYWGVDVARFGDDSTTLAKRQGNTLLEKVKKWKKLDLMQVVGVIVSEWNETPVPERPAEILVDSIGLGSGVVDRLLELKLPARGINVSESPALKGSYANLRTELWFLARAWFEKRDCKMPFDEDLCADLVSVKYLPPDSTGKLRVESKDATKKRLRRSPDVADGFLMTFAGDAGTALYGVSAGGGWAKPLKRNLPIV
jgi:phage terminase large subunit